MILGQPRVRNPVPGAMLLAAVARSMCRLENLMHSFSKLYTHRFESLRHLNRRIGMTFMAANTTAMPHAF